MSTLHDLARVISAGTNTNGDDMLKAMRQIFGERYNKRSATNLEQERPPFIRNAYSNHGEAQHIQYAGYINPENPPSGPYGGASLVWFPSESGCLIAFGIGTRGLSPDEGMLMRPGHRRRILSLRSHLVKNGIKAWARQNPATVGVPVPNIVTTEYPDWKSTFERYGNELYCIAKVPKDEPDSALLIVQSFLDLYAFERGWDPRADYKDEIGNFIAQLNAEWFTNPTIEQIIDLLTNRRFVVLEGPPGTGKSRIAEKILNGHYSENGLITQFHPSTTYEDFVAGLSPDVTHESLRFSARRGQLLEAADLASTKPALLVIDEINRADLGRVLGEAIYLFEAGAEDPRSVQLPHLIDGKKQFTLPKDLHVLATMNTADRSIARMDLAIRRRFAFVSMMPDRKVVEESSTDTGLELFDALCNVFLEHAPDDALALLPGHSYFIAKDDRALSSRIKHELLPLIDDYIREGYLGPATAELYAVRNRISDKVI